MRIGYRLTDKFDIPVFISVVLLIMIGLAAIYSSTVNHPSASGNFEKQLSWFIFSVVAFLITYFLPPQFFRTIAVPAYVVSILTLILVLVTGKTVYGSKSWLGFGSLGMQPSEFAKIGTIFFLAFWLTRHKRDINNLKDIGVSLLIGFTPIILILMQPDLGTAMVFGFITIVMIFWSGINLFSLFVVFSPAAAVYASLFGTTAFIVTLIFIAAALILFKRDLFISASVFVMNIAAGFSFDYIYKILQPHQQKRIESFLDPNADPLGSGYNALQAKVAIGSGGLWGKGFLEGNQTQLRFIPEQWTDFIYCVVGEEFGFLGSIFVVILFIIIFMRLLKLATTLKDNYSGLITIGILSMLFFHFAINIGMNLGITPVIGLPLPFLSYGGSSLLSNMILIGVALNFYKNRKQYA